jgi:hypothetical protein
MIDMSAPLNARLGASSRGSASAPPVPALGLGAPRRNASVGAPVAAAPPSAVTENNLRALRAHANLGNKSWANIMDEENEAEEALPINARRRKFNAAEAEASASASRPAVPERAPYVSRGPRAMNRIEGARLAAAAFAAPRGGPTGRGVAPAGRAAAPKPRPGKVMKECRTNNAMHAHESGAACKYVHKNEPEFGMLRPDQKRAGGSRKTVRKSKSKKARSTRRA